MSEIWAKTSPFANGVDTGNTVEFNWSIEKSDIVWGNNDGSGIDSPQFEVISERQSKIVYLKIRPFFKNSEDGLCFDHDGKTLRPFSIKKSYATKPLSEFLFLNLEICSGQNSSDKFDMAGSLNIETPDKKFYGTFGHHESLQFQKDWVFKNRTAPLATVSIKSYHTVGSYTRNQSHNFFENIFCVPKTTRSMVMKLKLNTPVSITTTTIDEFSFRNGGPPRLLADINSMLCRSSENGDFVIECGGERFPCHEFILRARSSVLEGMLHNQMLERENRRMTLEDVGSNTVAVALEYMYTGEVTKEIESVEELIYFAEKYAMDDLLALCFQKLPQDTEDVVVDCLIMADKLNLVDYKTRFMHRIHAEKSKFLNDEVTQEKLKEFPHLLLELLKM